MIAGHRRARQRQNRRREGVPAANSSGFVRLFYFTGMAKGTSTLRNWTGGFPGASATADI